MNDTQQIQMESIALEIIRRADLEPADHLGTLRDIALALTQAEQRGMERAAGMVEGEYWGWTPQALAQAIRAAKEAR